MSTPEIIYFITEISKLLGKLEGLSPNKPKVQLRKQNQIKTIHASLSIEGNTLSYEQITALIEGKRVIGKKIEIQEVQNAIQVYQLFSQLNPFSEGDFLKSHKIMMKNLTADAGKYRSSSVGVWKGSQLAHLAPPARIVPELMNDLFNYLKSQKKISLLIRACLFHYEIEFIHPFSDGNGRMGRLWQQLTLKRFHPFFEFISIETIIKEKQKFYYSALEKADQAGHSTSFIEFSLSTILSSLEEFYKSFEPQPLLPMDRLKVFQEAILDHEFSRKSYISFFKTISTATASRDLALGCKKKLLKKENTKSLTKYKFLKTYKNKK